MRRSRPSLTVSQFPAGAAVAAAAVAVLLTGSVRGQITAGSLDPSFGGGKGWVKAKPGGHSAWVESAAVQPDGACLYTGTVTNTALAVWRLTAQGAPDTSFNGGGVTLLPGLHSGHSLAVRSDGHIFAGSFAGNLQLAVASFYSFGYPDDSFGPNYQGWAMSPLEGVTSEIALLPDGKVLACGLARSFLTRFLPNGTIDPGFGDIFGGGTMVGNPFGGCTGLALQSDGKFLICMRDTTFTVIRFLPGGIPDPGFGGSGAVSIMESFPSVIPVRPVKTIVRPDGKIVVAGIYDSENPNNPDTPNPPDAGFALVRFHPDGSLDTAFGDPHTPGLGRISFNAVTPQAEAVAVQNDGRIVIAGQCWTPGTLYTDIALARFTAGGRADPGFGVGGRVIAGMDGTLSKVGGGALMPDGKLVLGGSMKVISTESPSLLLARFVLTPAVALSVEYPAGTPFPAPPVDFGIVTAPTAFTSLTLRNSGAQTLTNIRSEIVPAAAQPGEFHATLPGGTVASLAPGAPLSVQLSLAPSGAPGLRTAAVRFTADNFPAPLLTVSLTGTKATPQQIWRVTWFGSPDNSGPGADAHDFDHDGLPNFLEYATRSHPHLYTHDPCQPAGGGQFTYTRPAAALTEFSYHPESAPSPAGPWSTTGLTTTVLTDDGTVQTVQVKTDHTAAPRLFLRLRATKL